MRVAAHEPEEPSVATRTRCGNRSRSPERRAIINGFVVVCAAVLATLPIRIPWARAAAEHEKVVVPTLLDENAARLARAAKLQGRGHPRLLGEAACAAKRTAGSVLCQLRHRGESQARAVGDRHEAQPGAAVREGDGLPDRVAAAATAIDAAQDRGEG